MGNWYEEAVRRLTDAKLVDPDNYFEVEENSSFDKHILVPKSH